MNDHGQLGDYMWGLGDEQHTFKDEPKMYKIHHSFLQIRLVVINQS